MGTIRKIPKFLGDGVCIFPALESEKTAYANAAPLADQCAVCDGRGQIIVSKPKRHLAYMTCHGCRGKGVKKEST